MAEQFDRAHTLTINDQRYMVFQNGGVSVYVTAVHGTAKAWKMSHWRRLRPDSAKAVAIRLELRKRLTAT